ncbi:hypothetical protein M427DRAFT_134123 [Gonapodya prolifera JEL478]|uniref:WD40 repeat-like protein n=1 Tax=Gonapodya prolifera (strain JEL478) TaxID=1344416 RepID=A0A139AI83_GONPJ|nr:hypothetical protein M427DRAFT_134123 [Gonapodya prolifera JEL478]|eukprot:KXS16521.1 hypothetical protein M427DRAFT_134123 [Gonapodya prolifera JEL478]
MPDPATSHRRSTRTSSRNAKIEVNPKSQRQRELERRSHQAESARSQRKRAGLSSGGSSDGSEEGESNSETGDYRQPKRARAEGKNVPRSVDVIKEVKSQSSRQSVVSKSPQVNSNKKGRPRTKPRQNDAPASEAVDVKKHDLRKPIAQPSIDISDNFHSFRLTHIIRPHSDPDLGPDDVGSESYAVRFAPPAEDEVIDGVDTVSHLCASAGSNRIAFIDCRRGLVRAAFSHRDFPENYLCIAWTVIEEAIMLPTAPGEEEGEGGEGLRSPGPSNTVRKPRRLLAAGGETGTLYILDDTSAECVEAVEGHAEPVRQVEWSRADPRWLFSCGNDVTVRWWTFGTEGDGLRCLATFNPPDTIFADICSLALLPPTATLPRRCAPRPSSSTSPTPEPILAGDHAGHIFLFRPDLLARTALAEDKKAKGKGRSKGVRGTAEFWSEWHAMVQDVALVGSVEGLPGKTVIASRDAQYLGTVMWDLASLGQMEPRVLGVLKWDRQERTLEAQRMRIVGIAGEGDRHGRPCLVTGASTSGDLQCFDLANAVSAVGTGGGSWQKGDDVAEPDQILAHFQQKEPLLCLDVSSCGTYLVAGGKGNAVYVWTGPL